MEVSATCTRCGHKQDLWATILQAISDASTQAAIRSAMELPTELADQVFRYMSLFGNIRQPTYARLLGELSAAIKGGKFQFKRREYPAPLALWSSALADVLSSSTITLPLKANHNYLYAIAVAKLEKHTAATEAKREEQLRQGIRQPQAQAPTPASNLAAERLKLLQEVNHWQTNLQRKPDDETIRKILNKAQQKLAEFDAAHSA